MKKGSYNENEIIACAQGKLFGSGRPRLPAAPMLMVSRINEINETGGRYQKGAVVAELDLSPDLWFFGCHFIRDPVMPGCLGLDALWQLIGFFLTWSGFTGKGRALGCKEVKFTGQILPTNKQVSYNLEIRRVISRKLIIAIADGTVATDGEIIYTAKGLRVGLFQN